MNIVKATALANAAGLEVSPDSKIVIGDHVYTIFHVGNVGVVHHSRDGSACYRYGALDHLMNFRGWAVAKVVKGQIK